MTEEVVSFQTVEGDVHFFRLVHQGDKSDHNSFFIVNNQGSISAPKQYPIISIEHLEKRYRTKKKMPKIEQTALVLQALLKREPIGLRFPDDTIEEEGDLTGQIEVIDYQKYVEAPHKWIENNCIPTSRTLSAYIEKQDQKMPSEVQHFILVLFSLQESQRQRSLTELVKSGTDSAFALLTFLLGKRDELTISVIRELARWNIDFPILNELIQRNTFDYGVVQEYSFLYMNQFHPSFLKNDPRTTEIYEKTIYYKNLSRKTIISQITKDLGQTKTIASRALLPLIYLSDDPMKLMDVIDGLYAKFPLKIPMHNIRSAILHILKWCEFSGNQHLTAVTTALSLNNRRISYDEHTRLLTKPTKTVKVMLYPLNRIRNLLGVWMATNRERKVYLYLVSLLKIYPPEAIDIEHNPDIHHVNQWILHHPLFAKNTYSLDYQGITNDQSNDTKEMIPNIFLTAIQQTAQVEDLVRIAYQSSQVEHPLLRGFLDYVISTNDYDFTELTNEQYLVLAPFIGEMTDETTDVQVISKLAFELNMQLFTTLHRYRLVLSSKIFSAFVWSQAQESDSSDLSQYVKFVGKEIPNIANEYAIKLVDQLKMSDQQEIDTKSWIIGLLTNWQEVSGIFPSDEVSSIVDGIKIIFQDKIENFDLEASQPLSVETIRFCYEFTSGDIPKFVETNIQFSFSKPVWDQLARHFLAMAFHRPHREVLVKSKAKDIPNYLLRDVLGQIALVNQTISYSERNGFTDGLENLIINNLYQRGWNVERRLERILPTLFGVFSSRSRSYFAAYLVTDAGDIQVDLLRHARDVEDYQIRDRLIRELDRYGTADMWLELVESYYEDISDRALTQISELRTSATERSALIRKMLLSQSSKAREKGLSMLENHGIHQSDLIFLLYNPSKDMIPQIIQYCLDNRHQMSTAAEVPLANLILKILWDPSSSLSVREIAVDAAQLVSDKNLAEKIYTSTLQMINVKVASRVSQAIRIASEVKGDD